MPQVVPPWTWRRLLRDFGPSDPGYLLAMLVLGTYMNRDGYAFPGQPLWAKGARKSPRTIQRYVARARTDGWLDVVKAGRAGQGWAFNAYRCCAPDGLSLDHLDQSISDALEAQCGGVEPYDTIVSVPSNGHDTAVSSRQASERYVMGKGDDILSTKVTTSGAQGHDTTGQKVTTSGCRTNSGSENSRFITHAQEQARLSPSVLVKGIAKPSEAERKAKILALHALPPGDVAHTLQAYGVTTEEVLRVRQSAGQEAAEEVW